jgi:hypothetical protein
VDRKKILWTVKRGVVKIRTPIFSRRCVVIRPKPEASTVVIQITVTADAEAATGRFAVPVPPRIVVVADDGPPAADSDVYRVLSDDEWARQVAGPR